MKRLVVIVSLVTIALAGAGLVHVVQGSATDEIVSAGTTTAPVIDSPYCRSNVLVGVHDSDRLQVISRCAQLDGIVVRAPKLNLSDGDVTFNVRPDSAFTWMANAKNASEGGIHVEVVPADQTGCTAAKLKKLTVGNLGTCTGADVTLPPLNAHVRVIAPYVYDRWVGWNEMHPAWRVDILDLPAPPPVAMHSYSASLRGAAVAGGKGAPGGTGLAALTLKGSTLCWRFTRVRRVGTPTASALTRGASSGTAALRLRLGTTYRASGCRTAPASVVAALRSRPRQLAVVVYAHAYPRGAVRGVLAPTSD